MLLVGCDQTPYFKCNDAAKVLGYVKYAQAVTNHVRPRQIKTLEELMKEGVPVLGGPSLPDQNDLGSRYMKESGLYRLIAKSKMHFAEAFQDWVEEEVLPSIRKTGSYSIHPVQPGSPRLHRDDNRLQEAAATAKARQHPRHTEHAGPGGQVLRRDMLPQICD